MPIDYAALKSQMPQKRGKFLKLRDEPNKQYEGLFMRFGTPEEKDFGNGLKTLIPAYFSDKDENGKATELVLSCGPALLDAFDKAGIDEGYRISIKQIEYQANDRDGNPSINANGTPLMLTGYEAKILEKDAKIETDEEINIDDIPF